MSDESCYSERVDRALQWAAASFRSVRRKGSDIPYLTHLLHVAAWVAEYGGDEDQIIAALLHDYLEDIPGAHPEELEAQFGHSVRSMVEALSDSRAGDKSPWKPRKEAHLARLRTSTPKIKLIAACDKLHNAESILSDLTRGNTDLWSRFSAPPSEVLWFYQTAVEVLGDGWQHEALDRLREAVQKMRGFVPSKNAV